MTQNPDATPVTGRDVPSDATPSAIAHSIHGAGPTLVLIHGICHSRHAWDDVLPGLVDHFRVVTIDLPGHAASPDPDSLDDDIVERMIDQLAAFLREVAVDGEKPHVAGNSLGGYFALELARRGHAASATAFNPAGFFHGPWDQRRTVAQFLALRGIGRVLRPMLPAMSKTAFGRTSMFGMFSAKPWRLDPAAVERDAKNMLGNKVIDHGLRASFTFSPDVAGAPQTSYWGTSDLTLIRGWKRHHEVLPDVPLHLLPGLGHVPMIDDGRTIADCIRRSAGV
ncbi:alpha/beta fold hydrolase [Corynebacterium hansenii]|uniref:Alpha/beta fold hydrolase n=1 Tax=Corynebacterium hansenii TaxID=394964 RepID=A0ABV7ZQ54_9CORY|nr:alpha/beta fold hydrolase [Corynebacterium hansenii]WJZ00480.1 N-acyl homoserine lactonase [Corynebacterium hansenii]